MKRLICALYLTCCCVACDDVDAGRKEDHAGPPKLTRIMVQDEEPFSGRHLATDLLDTGPEASCSDIEPCPTTGPACELAEASATGVCPRAYSPERVPPAIGTPAALGGNQIRVVFDKTLEREAADKVAMTKDLVRLLGPDGQEVPTVRSYDNKGSAEVSANPFFLPFGPALVLIPEAPLAAATNYSLEVTAANIRDKQGQSVAEDIHGPVAAAYLFTTEPLYVLGSDPDLSAAPELTPDTVLSIFANAAVSEVELGALSVRDAAGTEVAVEAAVAGDTFGRTIAVTPPGGEWADGEYSLSFSGFSGTFVVKGATR